MDLSPFLTPTNPLGPLAHEDIMRRLGEQRLPLLLYKVPLFDEVMAKEFPLVMGRRGSGKTAIVNAYMTKAEYNLTYFSSDKPRRTSRDLYIFINSWMRLADIVEHVGRDIEAEVGSNRDWYDVHVETVAKHWANRFWHIIFQHLYQEACRGGVHRDIRTALPDLISYNTGDGFLPETAHIDHEVLTTKISSLKRNVLDYLKMNKMKCYIIIDSLDTYPVVSPRFQRLLSGFIVCVNDFAKDHTFIRMVCCLPEEIEQIVRNKTSNKIKHLTTATSISKLRWQPIDLLRICASKYREFLLLHVNDDDKFLTIIANLDFSNRRELLEFYSLVMPRTVTNRFGHQENSLAYIIRHTQLLPREIILIIDVALVLSHQMNGSWRHIEPQAIVTAISQQESTIVDQILGPYIDLYPNLISAARHVLPEMRPIFNASDMDRLGGEMRTLAKGDVLYTEIHDPWVMLFNIGMVGYVDQISQNKHDLYEFAHFHFTSDNPMTIANDRRYCVHPAFSGSWNIRRPNDATQPKFIYPAKVKFDEEVEIWDAWPTV